MSCIAIDLHSDCFTAARRKNGDERSIKTVKTYHLKDESFTRFKESLSVDDYVAVEATTNAFWFNDEILPFVKRVIILDTNKVNFKGNKTDSNDAKRLLDVLEYFVYVKGENEIPQVYVPSVVIRDLRELFASYKLQKKIIGQLKNRIHSLLKQHGHVIKKSSLRTVKGKLLALKLIDNDLSKIEIKLMINQIEISEKYSQRIVELIAGIGQKYFKTETEILMTIPGFSFISALALIADMADIERFPTVKKFCSYLRVAPRIKESNKTTHIGNINKSSRTLTLTFLTQSVQHFRGSSEYFGTFYDRLKEGKSYGKTRIALIRKILVCAYYMLKRKENFKWSTKSNIIEKKRLFNKNAEKAEIDLIKIA